MSLDVGPAPPGPPAAPAFVLPPFSARVELPLPLSIAEFGFEEDKLLLSAFWGNCLPDTVSDEANLALCRLYSRARERNCILFPKPERYIVYSRALLARLDELLNSPACEALVALVARDLELSQKRAADVMQYYAGSSLPAVSLPGAEVGVPGLGPSPGFGGVFASEDGDGTAGAAGRSSSLPPSRPQGARGAAGERTEYSADTLAEARKLSGMDLAAVSLGPSALKLQLQAQKREREREQGSGQGMRARETAESAGDAETPRAYDALDVGGALRAGGAPTFSLLASEPRSQAEEKARLALEAEKYGVARVTLLVPVLGTFTGLKREHPLITDLVAEFMSRMNEDSDVRYLRLHARRNMLTRNSEFLAKVLYEQEHGEYDISSSMMAAREEMASPGSPGFSGFDGLPSFSGARGNRSAEFGDAEGLPGSFLAAGAPGDFLDKRNESFCAPGRSAHSGEREIILNDSLFPGICDCQSHITDFCHFDPGVMARFLLFCRHPAVILEQKYLKADVEKAEELLAEATGEFAKLVDARRLARVSDLAAWVRASERRLCAEVVLRFSRDVAEVRRRYESLLRSALAQLNRLHNRYKVEALEYYENMLRGYSGRLETVFSHGKRQAGVDRRLSDLRRLEEAIFLPLQVTPRMVVLAAALGSQPLMRAATAVLAREILKPEICGSDILVRCRLVPEQAYREILQKASTADLARLLVQAQINGCVYRSECANPEVSGHYTQQNIVTAKSFSSAPGALVAAAGDSEAAEGAKEAPPFAARDELGGHGEHDSGATSLQPPHASTAQGGTDLSLPSQTPRAASQPHATERSLFASRSFTNASFVGTNKVLLAPLEFLEEEVEHRKAQLREVYSKWSDERVNSAITIGTEPFLDILTRILEERKNGVVDGDMGAVVLAEVPWMYSLDPFRLTATLKVERRFAIIQPSQLLRSSDKDLKVYFEVTIKCIEGATVAVGVLYDREIFARMPGLDSGAGGEGGGGHMEGGEYGEQGEYGEYGEYGGVGGGWNGDENSFPAFSAAGQQGTLRFSSLSQSAAAAAPRGVHSHFPGSTAGGAAQRFFASATARNGGRGPEGGGLPAGQGVSAATPATAGMPGAPDTDKASSAIGASGSPRADDPQDSSSVPASLPPAGPLDTPAANGVCITADGYLLQMGRRAYTGEMLRPNDVIGVEVDMGAETVTFRRNGRALSGPHCFRPEGLVSHSLDVQSRSQSGARSNAISRALRDLRGLDSANPKVSSVPPETEAASGSALPSAYSALRGADVSLNTAQIALEERERAVDPDLERRIDSAFRSQSCYGLRPAAVLYVPALARPLGAPRPCVRFAFGAPFTYECPPGFGGDGYDTLVL